mgnify:CR=1 FL=1
MKEKQINREGHACWDTYVEIVAAINVAETRTKQEKEEEAKGGAVAKTNNMAKFNSNSES